MSGFQGRSVLGAEERNAVIQEVKQRAEKNGGYVTYDELNQIVPVTVQDESTTDEYLQILQALNVDVIRAEDVDNYRANLKAGWTISAHGDKDLAAAEGISDFPYTLNGTATQITTNLLIPEQSSKQIVINYSMGGKTFDYELNIPRTNWEMGKKYTFNLEFSAAEITLEPTVAIWTEVVDNEQIG